MNKKTKTGKESPYSEMWADWPFGEYFDQNERWANWPNFLPLKNEKK